MDRKNHRAGGTVSTAATALAGDDAQDEAVIWRRTLSDLQRLSEIMDASDGVINALDKVPEGRSNRSAILYQEAAEKAREEQEVIQTALENIKLLMGLRDGDLTNGNATFEGPALKNRRKGMAATDGESAQRNVSKVIYQQQQQQQQQHSFNTAEGKRKKRKIEAEGLNSNSKKIRRYSAADSNGIIPDGHQVAARTPKDKDKNELWILAKVLSYSAEKNKYVVEDDEADESGKKMTYTLHARSVIMITDDLEDVPEFSAGHTVLALYPATTCFYKAIVIQPPSTKNKDSSTGHYKIKFDDDEGIERTAPPRMVLDMPKLK
ncbi:hypothetical protein BGZ65_004777 [Modicella reniformis]|uniref:SGF29 C-terminal domain-containing protein n=1 Tax=Modicella reniformis TaxID=1440133 RepID=A0A9P6SLI3_9FUNG|nr:hypothetical protein BGZ65_004777 [Modicella reniformis]